MIPNPAYPSLTHTLSTREGFDNAVKVKRSINGALTGLLVAALLLLVYNIFTTAQTIFSGPTAIPSEYWLDVFFETHNTSGKNDPWLIAIVWGPVVLVPVLVVLFIVAAVTRKSARAQEFERFLASGFLATPIPTGITVTPAGQKTPHSVVALPAPQLDPGAVYAALQALGAAANQPDKKDRKPILTALSGIPVDKAIPAPAALPPQTNVPGLFFASVPARALANQGNQPRPLVVIPAENLARTACHPLKDTVPIG